MPKAKILLMGIINQKIEFIWRENIKQASSEQIFLYDNKKRQYPSWEY